MALAEVDTGHFTSVLGGRGPQLDSTSLDQLPAAASLFFPPFPRLPTGIALVPFSSFENDGLRIRSDDLSGPSRMAAPPNGTSPVPLAKVAHNEAERSAHQQLRKSRRLLQGKLGVRVERDDCWKIGGECGDWEEPENTSMSDYRQSIPPFTRLMSAVRDFLYSRHEEFQYNRSKRLFELMRIALGLRVEFAGNHWPGTGANAETYQMPRNAGEFGTAESAHHKTEGFGREIKLLGPLEDEVCVLLRDPVTCVRGLLALARREAEAGWDLEPAIHMAGTQYVRESSDMPEITSAFLAFVGYHQVLPEAELREGLRAALQLAGAAPRQLREAKRFEDELLRPASWNAALWVAYGRSWGHRLPKGEPEPEEPVRGTAVNEADRVDDGGWTVQITMEHLTDCLRPLAATSIELLQYIPYHRRRITEVLPPLDPLPGTPLFMTRLHRIVTEPAPWTPEEKWRVHRPQHDETHLQDVDDNDDTNPSTAELEEEAATTDFSGSITIWGNLEEYGASKEALIGMGLRGRWAMMGLRDAEQAKVWWTFKPKDFILPSFWQSEVAVQWTANHAHAAE